MSSGGRNQAAHISLTIPVSLAVAYDGRMTIISKVNSSLLESLKHVSRIFCMVSSAFNVCFPSNWRDKF